MSAAAQFVRARVPPRFSSERAQVTHYASVASRIKQAEKFALSDAARCVAAGEARKAAGAALLPDDMRAVAPSVERRMDSFVSIMAAASHIRLRAAQIAQQRVAVAAQTGALLRRFDARAVAFAREEEHALAGLSLAGAIMAIAALYDAPERDARTAALYALCEAFPVAPWTWIAACAGTTIAIARAAPARGSAAIRALPPALRAALDYCGALDGGAA